MAEKKKNIRITTPAGIAQYPWLQKADTRFKAEGVYTVGLVLPKAQCAELCAQLDPMAEQAYQDALADPKKVLAAKQKKKTISKNEPYLPELDEAGNETGNTVFKFRMNAQAEIKGETKFFKPSLFDAKGVPITKNINVYGGSTIKVNFSPTLYYTDASFSAGVSLRLNAVQVLKLVTGGYTAASCGFGVEEDGFEYADGAAAGPAPEGEAVSADTPASDF